MKAKATKTAPAGKGAAKAPKPRAPLKPGPDGIVRLSGGSPQIAKGYGDQPVQAYIAAMPGWQSDVGRKLDRIIERVVPRVQKAVKWNTPLYGLERDKWFLGFHVFTRYIKVSFFRGRQMNPTPPVESKHPDVRYFHIHGEDELDEAQFAKWVKQASRLPGEKM